MTKLPKKTEKNNHKKDHFEPEDILILLKQVALSSLSAADYSIALKALELWGKELGLFSQAKKAVPKKRLSDFSTKELETFLKDDT